MTEAEARALDVKRRWDEDKRGWVCVHCGQETKTFYIVTGHDHTDDTIDTCECRKEKS